MSVPTTTQDNKETSVSGSGSKSESWTAASTTVGTMSDPTHTAIIGGASSLSTGIYILESCFQILRESVVKAGFIFYSSTMSFLINYRYIKSSTEI